MPAQRRAPTRSSRRLPILSRITRPRPTRNRMPAALIAIAFAPLLGAAPAATATARPADAALFTLAVGANGPLGGEEQNGFFPCGGGPSSFEIDGEGRWWILDAIGS